MRALATNLMQAMPPADGGRWGWFGPASYRQAFGRGNAARKWRLAWIKSLSAEHKKRLTDESGRAIGCQVRGDAVLPEDGPAGGKTIGEFVQETPFRAIPDEIKRAG